MKPRTGVPARSVVLSLDINGVPAVNACERHEWSQMYRARERRGWYTLVCQQCTQKVNVKVDTFAGEGSR